MTEIRALTYFWASVAAYLLAFWGGMGDPIGDFTTICPDPAKEAVSVCAREWVGSLSGWIAALVAATTLWPLYRQLQHQQRQTDFQLGDALPTIDVTPDLDDTEVMVVRLVNWNRRGLLIHRLGTNLQKTLGLHETKVDGTTVPIEQMSWPLPLRGWEDRSKGPHHLQFKVFADAGEEILREWPPRAEVIVGVQVLGDRHVMINLTASVHP